MTTKVTPAANAAAAQPAAQTADAGRRPQNLWLAALMPPMYSVAVFPIALGSAIAFAETQHLRWGIFLTFLLSAILILAWENLSNDVFDAETGIDANEPTSLVNLTGNKSLIFWLGNLCLGLGIAGILAIAWGQQDFTILGLILGCCGLGYIYHGPPFRLGYQGLGEILCFLSFGPLAVSAAYYSQTQAWSAEALAASLLLGVSTSLILFCSHFHQVADDLAAGKRSPVVRLGTKRAAQLLPWLCGGMFGLAGLLVVLQVFPVWLLLVFISLPAAINLCRHALTYHDQPERVRNCKFFAVALHFWSSVLLCLSFAIAGVVS
ncbi:MAG: 2-carboxy-1,4-naphthoquinone phytyltransferase [Pegethrix bostrychoides GSE-TBD4-15B]|jgi:1,4-dihydroxy-2-naphthoate octaprenyltransferase|uniref:2-carboxy-1,4-naphthoquinone phytyltransferase n=1 Tax=Pegethrix bostrychoides GSE-TBD4-15B TaxID=2839662 RepID=A0A951PB44_9CYAN|nr:2-carboxy-1,4-naphthoquinone phytyltransferase [Pegethrix bostrychoides GSE-TBD4-15B]